MTAITATGVYESNTIPELRYTSGRRGLLFSGTLPTTLEVGMLDPDDGSFEAFTDGAVTASPTSFLVNSVPTAGLALNVSGGSPNFKIIDAGIIDD